MRVKLSSKPTNWILPSFQEEIEEFNRYKFSDEEISKIASQFNESNLVVLKDQIWMTMDNTDSWLTTNIKQVEDLADEYGKDYKSILKAFKNGSELPAPIVIKENNRYQLVAGNTRLMVARALGKRPKVLMINL